MNWIFYLSRAPLCFFTTIADLGGTKFRSRTLILTIKRKSCLPVMSAGWLRPRGLECYTMSELGVTPGRPQKSDNLFSFTVYALSRTGAVNILEHNERRLRVYVAATSVNFLSTVAEFIDP